MSKELVHRGASSSRGIEKAAVLMLSLDPSQSRRILECMEFEEIRGLSHAMSQLGHTDSARVHDVLTEFRERVDAALGVMGGYDATERLLGSFMAADRVKAIMDEIGGPDSGTIWQKLAKIDEAALAAYLKNEYPQTVAVVLSKIASSHAAKILASLPAEFALDVVTRMLRMDVVQTDVLGDVERTLRAEFMSDLARTSKRDNHDVMAEIFNCLDRQTENRLMAALEEHDTNAAERIKTLMFTFEDLVRLDAAGVQTLIRSVGNERIALALKGASDRLKELILSNMSERAAKILKEDMTSMGPVRLKDVEEAQQVLVTTTKDLMASGDILIADGLHDQLVY